LLSPGALILSGTHNPTLDTSYTIDILDHPHLGTPPFTFQLCLPPQGSPLGCEVCSDVYHNLPCISKFNPETPLGAVLLQHGQHNSSL
jgi:hypothetical protein